MNDNFGEFIPTIPSQEQQKMFESLVRFFSEICDLDNEAELSINLSCGLVSALMARYIKNARAVNDANAIESIKNFYFTVINNQVDVNLKSSGPYGGKH